MSDIIGNHETQLKSYQRCLIMKTQPKKKKTDKIPWSVKNHEMLIPDLTSTLLSLTLQFIMLT
jgi:hypothetical protein